MAHIERGGIRTLVEELDTKVNAILLGGAFYDVTSADSAVTDEAVDWGVRLYTAGGEPVDESDITTPGSWKVYRIRSGSTVQITASALLSAGPGRVFCVYDFPTADWDIGDLFYFVMTGTQYLEGVVTKSVPTRLIWGRVVLEHSVEDTYAAIGDVDAGLALVKASVDGLVSDLASVKAKTDGLNFAGDDVKATLDGEKVYPADLSIKSTTYTAGAITAGAIATGAITDAKIATNAITAPKIAGGAIAADKIAADAVTKIQAGLGLARDTEALLGVGRELFVGGDWERGVLMPIGGYSTGSYLLTTERAHSGTTSMKWVGGSTGGFRISGFGSVCAGDVIHVEWWAYHTAEGAVMRTFLRDGTGTTSIPFYDSVTANTWTRLVHDYTIPADWSVVGFLIDFATNTAGTFYADDISVRRVGDTSIGIKAQSIAAIDTAVPATPRAQSLRDILHKDASGTYSRGTDSLEAIRDRIDTGLGATFNGATDSLEALRDRMDLIPGDSYNATEDALHMLSIYTRVGRYLSGNLGHVTTATKLYWTLSGTATTLEAPTVGSAWPGSFGDEIDIPLWGPSKTIRGPIESGPIFVQFGTITGFGSAYIHLEIKCHDDVWRQYSTVAVGNLTAATDKMFVVDPPKIVIDGVYVKSARYSLTAVGSPTVPGTLRISANWRHRIEVGSF